MINDYILAAGAGIVSTLYDPGKIDKPLKFLYQVTYQQACSFFVVFLICPGVIDFAFNTASENTKILLKIAFALSASPIIVIIKETTPKFFKNAMRKKNE